MEAGAEVFSENARYQCETLPYRFSKKMLGHFQNLIIYYNGELLDQFRQQTRRNTKYLAQCIEGNTEFDHTAYQQKFGRLGDDLQAFTSAYRKYKKEFFEFLEEVMEHSVTEPTQ